MPDQTEKSNKGTRLAFALSGGWYLCQVLQCCNMSTEANTEGMGGLVTWRGHLTAVKPFGGGGGGVTIDG